MPQDWDRSHAGDVIDFTSEWALEKEISENGERGKGKGEGGSEWMSGGGMRGLPRKVCDLLNRAIE